MRRFAEVLDRLPKGCVFDGELVVLDDTGRPQFNELLFGRGRPTYVAFDLLEPHGVDLRPCPLWERKATLAAIGKRAEGWIALTNGVVGEGRALFQAVVGGVELSLIWISWSRLGRSIQNSPRAGRVRLIA
jgi:ATP-dependent DNA ligase